MPNSNANKDKPSFLILKTRIVFNCLQLIFNKASILYYFDLKCYIWIKTDILAYVIGSVLSQLTSKTSLDRVATKCNLS